MNILLLDGQTVQAITIARSLKKMNANVIALIDSRISYGYVSRFIDKKIISPHTLHSDFKSFLYGIFQREKIDVVIPLYDDSASFLSQNKEEIELKFHLKCAVADYNLFQKADNKELLMSVCRDCGLPHPRTFHLSKETIDQCIEYVGFPSLIKPNISAGAKGIVEINNKEELLQKYQHIIDQFGPSTLQYKVNHSGYYYNAMMFRDSKKNFHESTLIKIMRFFPLKGGTGCYNEVIENNSIVDVCKKLLDSLDWVGFADIDIMEEKDTGKLFIIEINPRIPACMHSSFVYGVNYPEMIVNDLLNKKIPLYNTHKNKIVRFMGLDFLWFLFSKERFQFKHSWFNFFGKNVFYQDGSWRDPLPMIFGILSGFIKYSNPSFRKSKLQK